MRSSITLDQSRRNHVVKFENTYKIWKARSISDKEVANTTLTKNTGPQGNKSVAELLLSIKPLRMIQVRRRCVVSGRGRGVYRKFRRSRILVRDRILKGEIPCTRKMTW